MEPEWRWDIMEHDIVIEREDGEREWAPVLVVRGVVKYGKGLYWYGQTVTSRDVPDYERTRDFLIEMSREMIVCDFDGYLHDNQGLFEQADHAITDDEPSAESA